MEKMLESAVANLRSEPAVPEGSGKKDSKKESKKDSKKSGKVKEMPKARDRAEYEAWFRAADKNNDGFLTNKELKALFKSKGYKVSSKQLKAHFADIDSDNDKKVTLEEYLKSMDKVPALDHEMADIRQAFEKADKDGNGQLDLDEMKEVLKVTNTGLTGKQLFDIMHKADKDNSGVINYEEFIDLYMREHHLTK